MNQITRNLLIAFALLVAGFLMWFFVKIVIYILIAAILSFIADPIYRRLRVLKIREKRMPSGVATLITFFTVYGLIFLIIFGLIPTLIFELNVLSSIDTKMLEQKMDEFFTYANTVASGYNSSINMREIKLSIINYFTEMFNVNNLSMMVSEAISLTGSLLAGFFAVSFIFFFFLRDNKLFDNMLTSLVPPQYENSVKEVIVDTKVMLGKYIRGLVLDMIIVGVLVSIGLKLVGVKSVLVIGITAGILNIIPYIGPVLSMILGLILAVAGGYQDLTFASAQLFMMKIAAVFIAVQLLDGLIFQPLIFSKTVQAHPLEVFIVILMAGTIGGIVGMIFALPGYIVVRIIAREFFSKYKIVQKLTDKL